MSEAFSAAQAEAEQEEADFVEPVETEEEGEQPEAKATDWEKKFHDAKGQAAKERSRRQTSDRGIKELTERLAKLEAAGGSRDPLEELAAQLRDDTEDPINDIEGMKKIIRKFLADQKAERETTSATTAQQRQAQELINTMSDYEADFASDHPDYHEAAKFYRAERQAELEELGYAGAELNAALARDLFGNVQRALSAGRDPAEATYNLAKKRGFTAGTDSTAEKLAKIAGASAAGVRPGAGKSGGGALTWGAVANMKGPDRDKAFAKLREQERRAG